MEELAIRVEHVSKEYRLGAIGGATLKGEIQSKLAKLFNKEDPNLKIGEKAHGKNERFLALNDMSFDIKKGETVGIIGRNGAGKSTILKLICRVTAPTKGNIYLNGRITSMLEVGTGFHPELTGRENVYLNGAILGMTKAEIDRKFDEIVEFSEVGQFIDTPVKRYSSGMKVKLAFAVASHLDSEIMIMDEVLAVGDVAFQNKCIARMKKVAEEEGRTILYVSHNMATVKSLCNRCIVLSHGHVAFEGATDEAISVYMQDDTLDNTTFFDVTNAERQRKNSMRHVLQNLHMYESSTSTFEYGEKFPFRITWKSENDTERVLMKMVINGIDTTPVGVIFGGELKQKTGENSAEFAFDTSYLVPGRYTVDVLLYDEDEIGSIMYHDRATALRFNVEHGEKSLKLKHWFKDWGNAVLPCIEKIDGDDKNV
ncbi:MAG: polysaccharide ABC transporter ATP-binding protein [Acutalibacteraceae bacterium]|nr:polysaccharide ABC transporter ATP-binding protein [Acutalibacteraceae bacterium]